MEEPGDLLDRSKHLELAGVHGLVPGPQHAFVHVLEAVEADVPDVDVAVYRRAALEAVYVVRVYDPVALAGLRALALGAIHALAELRLLVDRTGLDAGSVLGEGPRWALRHALRTVDVLPDRFTAPGSPV